MVHQRQGVSRTLRTVAVWACVVLSLSSGAHAWTAEELTSSRAQLTAEAASTVPGRYIVQLSADAAPALDKRGLAARAEMFTREVRNHLGHNANVHMDYASLSGRFDGLSVEVDETTADGSVTGNTSALAGLQSVPGVVAVWPVQRVYLNHTQVPSTTAAGGESSDPSWNPHISTRVQELHERGFRGSGQQVCVVDTGVDVSHPALIGKITGGRSVTGDGAVDDISDCTGHGTFVSSIIVADTADLVGVAPDATVSMYKVFATCDSSTTNDLILAGLLAADADDCDIVSLSAGYNAGYSGGPLSLVSTAIAQDRLVVVAAGNAGAFGVYYASAPAAGVDVIAVASSDADQTLGWPATLRSSSGDELAIVYVTPTGASLNDTVSVAVKFDAGDSCNMQTDYSSNHANEAVVVKRGICAENIEYTRATGAGFGYNLLFDSYAQGVTYLSEITEWSSTAKLFAVTTTNVGPWAQAQIAAGNTVMLEITAAELASAFPNPLPGSGQMSEYTSWGPTFENGFFPSITAPGGKVYGALPDGGYAVESGTSFSTPYISGVAALFYAHVVSDPVAFRRRLFATATLLPAYDDSQISVVASVAPLAQQGAGLVDAVGLFDYTTLVQSSVLLALNDTDNRVASHTVRLANTGNETVVYTLSHITAPGVQARDVYGYPQTYYSPLVQAAVGTIEMPDKVTLAAGASQDVTLTFNAPSTIDQYNATLWSGKVTFVGSNNEAVAVAYSAIEASTYAWTPFPAAPPVFRYNQNDGVLYPVNYGNVPYKPAGGDSPEIYFVLRYGTYEYAFDLVGPDWTTASYAHPSVPEVGNDAWYGTLLTSAGAGPYNFPVRFSSVSFVDFNTFSNGTDIPSGQYCVLSRALRMFGDASNPADWQLYMSDPFWVQLHDDPIPGFNVSSPVSSSVVAATTSFPVSSAASAASTSSLTVQSSSIPAATTSSSTVQSSSSPATSVSSPVSPSFTTTLTALTTPTGVAGAFTNITMALRTEGISRSTLELTDSDVWLWLHVQTYQRGPLADGAIIAFAVPPEIVSVAGGGQVQSGGNLVGTSSFNAATGVFSITFSSWATWNADITGDFYLTCKIDENYAASMQIGTYVLDIATSGGTVFSPTLVYVPIDRSEVYEHVGTKTLGADAGVDAAGQDAYFFTVEVPSAPAGIGAWTSVTLRSTQNGNDGFACKAISVQLSTALDATSHRVTAYDDVTTGANTRTVCAIKQVIVAYNTSLPDDSSVLQIIVPALRGLLSDISSVSMVYTLDFVLPDGSTITTDASTLIYFLSGSTSPDNFFSGSVYTGETTTSLSTLALSTTASSLPAITSFASVLSPSVWPCRTRTRTL